MSGTNIDANPGNLPQLPTFLEGQHRGEFLVSEAHGYRSRDLATITNAGSTQIIFPAGLVVEIATPQNGSTPAAVQPYTATVAAGTKGALLFDNVILAAGGTSKVTIVSRDAEFNAAEIRYDASITTGAQQATILAELATSGLIAR